MRIRIAGAVCTASLLLLAPAAAPAATRTTHDMFGKRYCEYLAIKGAPPDLSADVWNTFGLNTCPEAQWRASDPAALRTELGALAVVLNGPRYWLMDRASITLAPGLGQVRRFSSGLRMRRIASVQIDPAALLSRNPYTETVVRRANTFTWSRRHRVYELVAPGGRVYLMQAYAQIVDPALSLRSLRRLGSRLALPEGWRYRTRRLRRDVSLTTRGRAIVVQDELQNTYQLEKR